MLWQIQVVNIVAISGNLRKQNTWRWRAEGRGYCQGSPGRRWRGWRHHWCRTPTASPPRRRPSGPITAAQAHIPTDAELKVRFNFLGIPVNWSCLTLVTMWYGSLDHINVKGHQDSGYTRMVLCLSILVIVTQFHFGSLLVADLFSFTAQSTEWEPAWSSSVQVSLIWKLDISGFPFYMTVKCSSSPIWKWNISGFLFYRQALLNSLFQILSFFPQLVNSTHLKPSAIFALQSH